MRTGKNYALAEDGQEARVEPAQPFFARKPREATDEPRCVSALRDEPDARCLEGSEQDVREESALL